MTTHRNTSQDFSTINNNMPDDTIIKLNQNQFNTDELGNTTP